MKKQSGFTLIELMVVMAIIAILATAGLSAYGGYLKKARDSTRIADLRAIESVILSSLTVNGSAPNITTLQAAISAMNNNVGLQDPMATKDVCCNENTCDNLNTCNYEYGTCPTGAGEGYVLRTKFESASNARTRYNNIDLDYYQVGNNCTPSSFSNL